MHSGRRWVAGLLLVPALAGCSALADKVGTKELTVIFVNGATASDADRVRAACADFSHIAVEPPATNETAANRRYPLRYDITKADDSDLVELTQCLGKDPSVRTYAETGGASIS